MEMVKSFCEKSLYLLNNKIRALRASDEVINC
jgi:hypothetical protein